MGKTRRAPPQRESDEIGRTAEQRPAERGRLDPGALDDRLVIAGQKAAVFRFRDDPPGAEPASEEGARLRSEPTPPPSAAPAAAFSAADGGLAARPSA